MKKGLFCALVLGSLLILSGCVARTYSVTKDRVDQDLSSGNKGYLKGSAPAEEATSPRKTERTIRIFEVELGKPYPVKQGNTPVTQTPSALPLSESSMEEAPGAEPISVSGPLQKYTVGKNDTLQKISKKFYGTTKKWPQIYNANKDVLKGPDKVYPGQVLNIPGLSGTNTPVESLKEPQENLK